MPMKRFFYITFTLLVAVACSNDSYDMGDGEYSYLRADFSEVHTTAEKTISWAVNDDLDTLIFTKNVTADWALKADSAYRALLYYNVSDDKVEPVLVSRVPVLKVLDIKDTVAYKTDAVKFESSWLSRGGRYLNLGLYLMIGKTESTAQLQKIGVRRLSAEKVGGEYKSISFLLTHDQNGVPENYSSRCYVSIPVDSLAPNAVINVAVNTYDGEKIVTVNN